MKIHRNSTESQWSRLRIEDACVHIYLLQFLHVETGQTPEETVAIIKVTIHQGIRLLAAGIAAH